MGWKVVTLTEKQVARNMNTTLTYELMAVATRVGALELAMIYQPKRFVPSRGPRTYRYYFSPETKAPISLLELGAFKDKECIVCCPEGFYRKGNVDIFCARYGIPLVHDLETLASLIQRWFEGECT